MDKGYVQKSITKRIQGPFVTPNNLQCCNKKICKLVLYFYFLYEQYTVNLKIFLLSSIKYLFHF